MSDWFRPDPLDGWPTWRASNPVLGYRVRVPLGWHKAVGERRAAGGRDVFRGPTDADWLSVERLEPADPDTDVGEWFDATVLLSGNPCPDVWGALDEPPRLLGWSPVESLARPSRAAPSQLRLFEGLASQPPSFARLYGVAVRDGRVAWKVVLSLASACGPGCDDSFLDKNDHARARATVGTIVFTAAVSERIGVEGREGVVG